MKEDNNKKDNIDRRKVLRTSSAALMSSAIIPTVGTANSRRRNKEREDKRYEAAMKAREKTGDTELFRKILAEGGREMATKDLEVITTWSEVQSTEGEVSTQALNKTKFDVELTMFKKMFNNNIFVDANWEHEVEYTIWANEAGEPPHDYAGLAFEHTDYELEGWSSGNATEKDTYNSEGVAFKYCDACCEEYERATGECQPTGGTFTIWDYCQIEVTPDQETDPSKRKVFFDYHHIYSDIEVQSISISYNGLSVSVSDTTKKWEEDAYISEDDLEYYGM